MDGTRGIMVVMPVPVEMRQPVTLRMYIGAFGFVWCGFLLVGMVAAPSPIPVVMLLFGATFTYRIFNLQVIADENGLLVRNNFRTRHFDWPQIEDFRIGSPAMGLPFGKVIHVLVRGGDVMTLDVSMRPWLLGGGRQKLQNCVDQLRAWLPPSA